MDALGAQDFILVVVWWLHLFLFYQNPVVVDQTVGQGYLSLIGVNSEDLAEQHDVVVQGLSWRVLCFWRVSCLLAYFKLWHNNLITESNAVPD